MSFLAHTYISSFFSTNIRNGNLGDIRLLAFHEHLLLAPALGGGGGGHGGKL